MEIRAFSAVVLTVLYYGLESVVFTKALKDRVDYFHTKCIRNILKIDAAYYSKVSNQQVLDLASKQVYGEEGKLKIASKTIADRAITLLGHVIRAPAEDLMHKVAIDANFARVERSKRRVGRPRFYWLQLTMDRAFRSIQKKENKGENIIFDIHSKEHRNKVAKMAQKREYPFHKKGKKRKKKAKKRKADTEKNNTEQSTNNKYHKNYKPQHEDAKNRHKHKPGWNGGYNQFPPTPPPTPPPPPPHNEGGQTNTPTPPTTPPPQTQQRGNVISEEAKRRLQNIKGALKDAFELIGCEFTLNVNKIKKAYRKKALTCHPDKGGTKEQFQQLGRLLEKTTIAITGLLRNVPELITEEAATENQGTG